MEPVPGGVDENDADYAVGGALGVLGPLLTFMPMGLIASRRRKADIESGYPIQDGQTAAVRTKRPWTTGELMFAFDPLRTNSWPIG